MTKDEFNVYLKSNYPYKSSFVTGFTLFIVDIISLFLCIFIGFFIVNIFARRDINLQSCLNYFVYFPAILGVFAVAKLYPGIMIPPEQEVKKYAFSTFFCFSGIIVSIIVGDLQHYGYTKFLKRGSHDLQLCIAFFIAFCVSTVILPALRELTKIFFKKFKWWGIPAVIYTDGTDAIPVIDRLLEHRNLGYHPCCIIDSKTYSEEEIALGLKLEEYRGIPVFEDSRSDIKEAIKNFNIKTAILCHYQGSSQPIMSYYRYTITVSRDQTRFTSTQHLKDIAGIIGLASTHNLTFKSNVLLKRFFDVGMILLFSPILIPVFLIISILVKLTSKGPVFYGHKRVGRYGKEFKCWKFRSMNINSQEMLKEILATDPERAKEWAKDRKFKDDPRVTKFGKFLRKTSLDELPQLINILVGQMSFIGPRPVTEDEMDRYGPYKDYVLSVAPGLSGMWQVSGRSDTGYEERISFDTYYIQNWSIWLDIWIFIKTVWVVLNHKGAY